MCVCCAFYGEDKIFISYNPHMVPKYVEALLSRALCSHSISAVNSYFLSFIFKHV